MAAGSAAMTVRDACDGGGSSLAAPPAAPESLIGRLVHRCLARGIVTWTEAREGVGRVWRVEYPDCDVEELTWQQLAPALLPRAGAAHGGEARAAMPAAAADGGGASFMLLPLFGACPPPAAAATRCEQRRYYGVHRIVQPGGAVKWRALFKLPAHSRQKSWTRCCADPLSAARAYDDMARQHGATSLNFPDLSAGETQAAPSRARVVLPWAARTAARTAAALLPREHHFKGVHFTKVGKPWKVKVKVTGREGEHYVDRFDDAVEAALAYDKRARELGITELNFPRHGTDETQAAAYYYKRRTKRSSSCSGAHAAPPPLAAAAAASDHEDAPVTAAAQQLPAASSSGGAAFATTTAAAASPAAAAAAAPSLSQAAGGCGDAAWMEAFLRAS